MAPENRKRSEVATDAVETAPLQSAEKPRERASFTPRAILLAVLLAALGIGWAIQDSLITQTVYIGGSVPPIPVVAILLAVAAINPWLRERRLSQSEILLIVVFVGIAVAVTDPNGLMAFFFSFIIVVRHAPVTEHGFGGMLDRIPDAYVPRDARVIAGFLEGHAPVAWGAWAAPMLGWGAFFCAMWVTTYALLRLFRDRWIAQDRLRFPIVDLMVHLTPPDSGKGSFLRNPLLWAGIGAVTCFDLLNIANAFDPGIPAPGDHVDVGALFTQPPWSAISPAWASLRPEIFGIGYLMNTDVLFTSWFSVVALRLGSVIAMAMGYEVQSGYYDYGEIATGAYLGVLFALIWMGRGSLRSVLRQAKAGLAFYPPDDPRAAVTRRNRYCVLVAGIGFGYQLWWTMLTGMAWWIGALYLALLIGFALVYARIRAETGAPIWYLFPFWQQQKVLINVFGTSFLGGGGGASLAGLAVMGFLARGTFPQLAAFQIEAMEIGERTRIKPRHLTACVLFAMPFGLLLGLSMFLMASYHFGFYSLDGGIGDGGYRVSLAVEQYHELMRWRSQPTGPNLPLVLHTLLGVGLVVGISALRSAFLECPLHPLGFAMASSYGFHLWAPFLAVWICKLLILKAGGGRLYQRLLPFFVGIVAGHYLVMGVLWGGLSLYLPELTRKIIMHFG